MSVLKCELKKIFIKRKILLIILLVLAAKAGISFAAAQQHVLFEDKEQREKYQSYIADLEGPLTLDKETFIASETKKYDESDSRVDSAIERFSAGQISGAEFDELVLRESEYSNNRPVIEYINKQFEYVSGEPSSRYFVDVAGWDDLLAGEFPDYLLIFAVIIICAILFIYETESGMAVLNLTSVNGRKKLCIAKIAICCISCALLVTSFLLIDIAAEYVTGGLNGFEYPLQSVPFFETASGSFTLSEVLIRIFVLRLVGVVFLSSCILLVSVLSKSTIITLVTNMAIAVLPIFMCGSIGTLFLLPFPAGFIIGSGFFRGTEVTTMDDGSLVYYFREVPHAHTIMLFVGIVILTCIFFLLTMRRYAPTSRSRYGRAEIRSIIVSAGAALMVVLILWVCYINSGRGGEKQDFLFNSANEGIIYSSKNYTLLNTNQPYFVNNKTGKVMPLLLSPIERLSLSYFYYDISSAHNIMAYFDDNKAYMLISKYSNSEVNPFAITFEVYSIDLDNFNQTLLTSQGNNDRGNALSPMLELLPLQSQKRDYFSETSGQNAIQYFDSFFVFNNKLYTVENKSLRCRNFNGASSILFEDIGIRSQVSCDGENIYYINNKSELISYPISEPSRIKQITSMKADGLFVAKDFIYFNNLSDNRCLYRYDKDSGKEQKISDSEVKPVQITDSYIYYLGEDDKIMRMPPAGGKSEALTGDNAEAFYFDEQQNILYFETYEAVDGEDETAYYIYNINESKKIKIEGIGVE